MEVRAGRTLREAIAKREREDPRLREAREKFAPFGAIARQITLTRMQLGLTQSELAKQLGTTKSAVSRMESGRQSTTVATLQRVSEALLTTFVISPTIAYSDEPEGTTTRTMPVARAAARTRVVKASPAPSHDLLRVSVTPHPNERAWIVGPQVVGARKASVATSTEPTQEAAVEVARGLLLRRGGGELQIHRQDGSLRAVRHVGSASRGSRMLSTES